MKKIKEEQLVSNISEYGNTSSASIPILLSEHQDLLESGKKIVMVGFGAGLVYGKLTYTV
jgi:3-oxoacyl-[acyl-carrier-protein] synthase-3